MRTIILLLTIAAVLAAQTPFEFAVVQDLIEGSPFISVIRIELNHGVPEQGHTQLALTTRAGMMVNGEHAVFPDSSTSTGSVFSGVVEYRATIPYNTVERVFTVLTDCMGRFPSTRITDLALDVVDTNDLSWISVSCPISRIDSVLAGTMSQEQFWSSAELREFEVGTAPMETEMRPPLVPLWRDQPAELPVEETVGTIPNAQPWKSLILPGWGQLSAGRGIGWLNLVVEAGGIALLATGEEEAGIAVLGTNHLVSFFDLF